MNKPLCIAVMASLVTPLVANANLLLNGSFEEGAYTGVPGGASWTAVPVGGTAVTGWISTQAGCDWHQAWPTGEFGPASDGMRMIDLTLWSDLGGIKQTFATIPGETYHLSFAVAGPAGASLFDVEVAGMTQSYSVPGTDRHAMVWETKSLDFIAIAEYTTLEFVGKTANYWGAVIDDVSVTGKGVPDAGSCLGLLAISSGLLLALRRRSR